MAKTIKNLNDIPVAHLIFNPASGQRNAKRDLVQIRTQLEPHLKLQIHLTTRERDAQELAHHIVKTSPDCIIAAGGDGTIAEVAGELINTSIPLGIIPRGTANSFATALGISTALAPIKSACKIIVNGKKRVVDTALCQGIPFTLMARIGYGAELMEKANRKLKNRWGILAYLIAGWQQIQVQKSFIVQCKVEGEIYQFKTVSLTVANAAGSMSVLAQSGKPVLFDDGLLDVTIAVIKDNCSERQQKRQHLNLIMQMLGATVFKNKRIYPNLYHFRTPQLQVITNPPQKVELRGHIIGRTPINIQCLPQSLMIFSDPNPRWRLGRRYPGNMPIVL